MGKDLRERTSFLNVRLDWITYFNAINGDVDRIEADCSWSPIGTVGSISVGTDEHILAGSVWAMNNK